MKEGKVVKESAERIQYIVDYIVSYKTKIEALNKKGLFDTATLYEIFAQIVCETWFEQKFINLNSSRANFPYVDLISEDSKLYVQVSTTQDVPTKVKSTLEKIRDSKSSNLEKVEKLYFCVLSNDSIDKVKDYVGEDRIGNIDFVKKDNLITTDDIIQRAKTDIKFQKALFDFLQNENDSLMQIGDKLDGSIAISKTLIKNNIDDLLNDEYEIDRTELIRTIQEDGEKYISIQGEAGAGKSALCKKILADEELVLYARAEKISESKNLEDIWGFDIRKAAKYLKQRRLVIYIDALEFIADSAKTKLDLLQQIYETVKAYNNIFVITSCRSSDRNAFVKIENIYHIKTYEIDLLSDNQIIKVAQKYRIIQDLWDAKSYMQLLRSPFYLNLIIKEIKDFRKITDVEGFRNLIWNDVICMKGKSLPSGIDSFDIRKAVEKIVFDRARNFLTGIRKEEIGEEIVNALLSENIITVCVDDTVRLKYDIFEDICFERFIDSEYDNCKGNYDDFFLKLEELERCIYRRYQIWVENKLFTKGNREKFLFKLLDTDTVPNDWKTQTVVGIVKSNFCGEFIEEYEASISGDLLWEFVRLVNNFAFETTILNLKFENVYSKLKPIGMGRPYLINLIYKNGIHKETTNETSIQKLCCDYSQAAVYNEMAANSACKILEFYIEEKMKKISSERYYDISEEINNCLLPVYRMAKYSKEWLKQFWAERIAGYLNGDGKKQRVDEDIIEYVLKNAVPALAQNLPRELCEIADTYWIKLSENDERDCYYHSSLDNAKEYGLSRKADPYKFEYRNIYENAFLNILIQYNWIIALEWIIRLTNHVADSMRTLSPESVYEITIWEESPQDERKYICNPNFWLAGIQEHRVHELISDAIYLFTKMAIREINSKNNNEELVIKFAEYIKSQIVKKSNNTMMLSVLAEIGRNCEKIIPGYSLFLATSIDLVMLDSQKIGLLAPNPDKQLYEKLILMSVGIPELKSRYDIEVKGNDSLQEYVLKLQLLGNFYREKAERILDYLYSIIPNQGEFARYNLQIQKMDLRNASISKIDTNTYALVPEIEGDAKKIVEENRQSKYSIEKEEFQKIINSCNSKMEGGKFELQDCIDTINQLKVLIKTSDVPGQLQNMLVMIMACALSKDEITLEQRSELCNDWMEGIDNIFNNHTYVFEIALVKVLFKQVEYEMDVSVKNRMKRQMIDCLLYREQQGVISKIAYYLKEYLTENERLAKSLFNTIIEISEDKIAYYKYNVAKLNLIGKKIDYQPNRKKPPTWVRDIFEEYNIEHYQSKREEIIDMMLLRESKKDLSDWKIDNCDIQTLCYVSNCGLNFSDEDFKHVMRCIFSYIISIITTVKHYHEYLDVYAIAEIKSFIKKNLISDQYAFQLVDLLFETHDFVKMNEDAYEVYDDISSYILAIYFDGHSDAKVRRHCENLIKYMEEKILYIKEERVRNRLSSVLFLTFGKFHMQDWNEIYTTFSYKDKMFLNSIWSKYAWLHFRDFICVIDQMHIKALLPEVLIPLNISLQKLKENLLHYEKIVKESEGVINKIITKAFLDFNDEVKADRELTQVFENFLSMLIELDMEEAAVILDEFRIH